MTIDLAAASAFMVSHARPLERRWFAFLTGSDDPVGLVSALDAHRNADGGYGWAIEPDLRATGSQPAGALHAFEALEAIAPISRPRAAEVCDWLLTVTLPDGGLPFALPVADPTACAPFWAQADATTSSLHITAAIAGAAHRLARHDDAVRSHDWLARATAYCVATIDSMAQAGHAIELKYALQFLDACYEVEPAAARHLERLAAAVPPTGAMHVAGGLEDEMMRPLDFSPEPDRPLRSFFSPDVVDADLDRLASLQQPDGGWIVDYLAYSPAASLDWRCLATVRAVGVLAANGRVELGSARRPN